MKIYFLGAVSGMSKFDASYKKIISFLESSGHKVEHMHVTAVTMDDILKYDWDKNHIDYNKMSKNIKNSDIVIAEVSHPTLKIGYEIALALENEVPVLVLNSDIGEKSKFPLFLGYPKDKLILKNYDVNNMKEVLEKGIEEISQLMDIRFNFFISPKMSKFLDWISKDKMIPKAVFLRKLIEPEMEKAKEFPG